MAAILNFISVKFVMDYPCVRSFVLYSWSHHFAYFLSYLNITEFLKLKVAAKRPF